MSISLSSNLSASQATSHLSSVASQLQKSLNRLSSGSKIIHPSDDAGGLAVSMKMSAAIKRQAAVSANLSNAKSYLQTQDGALKTTSDILSRIGELKTLASDVTKNTTDLSNYNTEFKALQQQLQALSEEKFNGMSLFSTEALSVQTTADGSGSSVSLEGIDLLGGSTLYTDAFSGSSLSSDWTVNSGSATVNSGILTVDGGRITLNQSFNEPVSVSVEMRMDDTSDRMDVYNNGEYYFSDYIDGTEVPDGNWHELTFDLDVDGTMTNLRLDGADMSSATGTVTTTSGAFNLGLFDSGLANGTEFRNLSISQEGGSSDSNALQVASVADLSSLSLSDVKSAISDVASFRSQNGAQQSRLDFAQEQLQVNQSNLEAANSRIMDVDVASESTNLARLNILQQAGASMLQQANQSQQVALKLIG